MGKTHLARVGVPLLRHVTIGTSGIELVSVHQRADHDGAVCRGRLMDHRHRAAEHPLIDVAFFDLDTGLVRGGHLRLQQRRDRLITIGLEGRLRQRSMFLTGLANAQLNGPQTHPGALVGQSLEGWS